MSENITVKTTVWVVYPKNLFKLVLIHINISFSDFYAPKHFSFSQKSVIWLF